MKWEFEEELKKYGYSKECIDQVDSISEGIILEIGRTLKPDKEACFNRLESYRICLEALYELNAKKKEIEKTDEVVPEPSVLIRCLNKIRN